MKKSSDILAEAQTYIRQGWTSLCSARDDRGHSVTATSHRAVRWCMGGAVTKAAQGKARPAIKARRWIVAYLTKKPYDPTIATGYDITQYNDVRARTPDQVITVLEQARLLAMAAGD
jgi:hypothetical protein